MAKLSADDLAVALRDTTGWTGAGDSIGRTFQFDGFMQAVQFVNRIAAAAEAANHHPDIDIRYNRVTVVLSTHDEGGVTQKDVDLARAITGLLAG